MRRDLQAFAYNGRGWPTSLKATYTDPPSGAVTTYLDLAYGYDAAGNVLSMGSQSFTYDALDRLKTAKGGYGDLSWIYDHVGNRLSETRRTTTTSYGYDGAGMNLLASTSDGTTTVSFGYDAHGNLVSKSGGWSYAWNFDGLLNRATKDGNQVQAYRYDAIGRRVKADASSATSWTVSLFSGMDIVYEVDQAGAKTKYMRANGMLLAKVTPSGAYQYYLGDHLGSTRQVRDASRNLVFAAEYEPFGKAFSNSGSETFRVVGEKHDDPTGLGTCDRGSTTPALSGSSARTLSSGSCLGGGGEGSGKEPDGSFALGPLRSLHFLRHKRLAARF